MKVCIVTVYNSTNCGSYLQAYALRCILEQLGAEVSYLETKVKKNGKIFLRKSLRNLKHGHLKKIRFDYCVYKNFKDCLKEFTLCKMNKNELESQDYFILGSDEIWNVSRPVFADAKVFWGIGLPNKKIAYAPSVNTARKEEFSRIGYTNDALKNMDAISVRDVYSGQVISEYTEKDIKILCDPTFLLTWDHYEKIKGKCPYENFILVYSAGAHFSEEDIKYMRELSVKKGKKLVSFPHMLPWCDYQMPAHPLNAIAYFQQADYVITDTFHGTALSMIFNKEFAAVPRNNRKVSELLSYFKLQDLKCDDLEKIETHFDEVTYSKTELNTRINEERGKAIEYLREALHD